MKVIFSAALVVFCIAVGVPAQADAITDFYRGKTFSIVIGSPPGGEFSAWGHLVAQYIAKYIPGSPVPITQDMPGAGSLKATNWIYGVAAKDGSVIALIQTGVAFEPLLGGQGTQFDPLKMNWIGSPVRDTVVCAARKNSPVKTMQDLFSKELVVGASGSGSDTAIYPDFFQGLLGMKFRSIRGYPGIQDIMLAIERGELQGICTAFSTLRRQNAYADGKLNLLFQAALNKDPLIPGDVPLVTELTMPASDRQAVELFLARIEMGRPFVAPPGAPAARIAALRSAFAETMADKDFAADAKKADLNLAPISGEEILSALTAAYGTPKNMVARVIEILARSSEPSKNGQ